MPQHDDGQDDVSALTFFNTNPSGSDENVGADRQALIFSAASDDSGSEASVDALRAQASVESADTTSELDAIRPASDVADDAQEDEESSFLVEVTNLPGTVSIKVLPDGSVLQIDLSPKVASMTESALADEILVTADLARQKGLATQQAFITEAMQALGSEVGAAHEFVADSLELPTPQQAEAAQAQVFAARYTASTD
jgi:hypothetical protein